jgi:hypothetical protein
MDIRVTIFGEGLLMCALALLMVTVDANAQSTSPAAKSTSHSKHAPATSPVPDLEPKAMEMLKASSARLAAAHTLSFTAVETYEGQSRQGHPLVFANASEITVQRPDKLRVITLGDGPPSEFYYDGKTMTAFAPRENLIAVADAPPTIDTALEAAYHLSGTYFPFTDLIVTDPYKDMEPGLKLAYYVGQSHIVAETTTDIVAYVENGVFIQVWLGADDKLPRVIHAVYLDDPAKLRHNLLLSHWQLDPVVPANSFAPPKNAAGAARIPFAHPLQQAGSAKSPQRKPTQPQ